MTEHNLEALAAFLPAIQDPPFKAGEVVSPPKDEDGVIEMPYVRYSAAVDAFQQAAYDNGWVLRDFDWPTWAGSEEAARLRDDPSAIARATPDQLMRLLTVCIRQDRFADGALLAAFETGLIPRIVQRASEIVSSPER